MQGQAAEAAAQMRDVRQLHQQRTDFAQSSKLIGDGTALLKEAQPAKALERFQEAQRLAPTSAAAYYYEGAAEEKLGQPAAAIEAYKEALAHKPDYAEAHMNLGIVYARRDDREGALRELREAVLSDSDSGEAHYNLALILSSGGMTEEAAAELSTAISLSPDNLDARLLLANILAEQNKTDQAAYVLGEVIRRQPGNSEALNNLGLLWLRAGKFTDAQGSVRKSASEQARLCGRALQLRLNSDATREPAGRPSGVRYRPASQSGVGNPHSELTLACYKCSSCKFAARTSIVLQRCPS